MQVQSEDMATLLQLQQLDLEAIRIEKELSTLPQRKVIVAAREKKRSIEAKRDQVLAMKKAAEAKLSRVSDEDAALAEKQRATQEAVDKAQGNYRNVEAHAKEMNGFAKRRATLEADLDQLGGELSKIEAVESQVAAALAAVEAQEAEAIASFQAQGGALKNDVARVQAHRTQMAAQLPEDLLKTYEKTAARSGGVALGCLTEGRCSACRSAIEGGRLLDVKAQAPLGVCPHCKRLLIIQ